MWKSLWWALGIKHWAKTAMFTDFIASGGDIKIAKEKNRFCEKIQQTASLVGQGKLPGRGDPWAEIWRRVLVK